MRAKSGVIHKKRREKILKKASGFRGARHRLLKVAKQAVMKAGVHGFRSRRQHKRHMRALWIVRINAACRTQGISYSAFMDKLKKNGVQMDRRMLADLAMNDAPAFEAIVSSVK